MTLPASFPLSMSQVATELGLSLPLSINHPWVIALAGKSALPVSFSDLLGQSGSIIGPIATGPQTGNPPVWTGNFTSGFFGGGTLDIYGEYNFGYINGLQFQHAPNWSGNIVVTNLNTNTSSVFTKRSSIEWDALSPSANLVRPSQNDQFTIYPST